MTTITATQSGKVTIGGDLTVNRLGFGAMRITGRGIWGDPAITGKPVGNDILKRKKSLPLLQALNHPVVGDQMQGVFALPVDESQIDGVMQLLDQAETRRFAE